MALETGRLEMDQLFLGLTRPAMIIGVTYAWFCFEALIWATVFINTSDFKLLAMGAGINHFIGVMICGKEPRFMDLWMVRMSQCMKCKNTRFHGNTHSYDLYK